MESLNRNSRKYIANFSELKKTFPNHLNMLCIVKKILKRK